jgi:rare lipoprotein A (peptidoglycan hydrolase)
MGIEIKLVSELEGIFNTVTRNVAQSNEDSGAPATEVLSKGEKQFGTEGIFQYTKKAKEDNTKFLIRDNYSEDVTLTSFGKNILEQGGDYAMPNAIGKAGIIVHTPYSWDTEPIAEPAGDPDPSKRYGYFLGPSIYNSIERSYEWEPPQVSTGSQSDSQTRVTPAKGSVIASWYGPGFIGNKTANGEVFTGAGQTAAHKSLPFGTKVKVTNQNNGLSTVVTINDRGPYIAGRELDLSQAAAQKIGMTSSGTAPVTMEILNKPQADNKGLVSKPTTAPVGTFGAKPNPGVRSFENPNGPKKQEMGREEGQATLSVSTLMVPALVGVKPIDVLFIPAFDGGFIEDWKVTDVEYAQSGGSGEITVSIQASRIYGSGSLMNKVGEEWLQKANSLGLVGENASIANWERYAWKLDGSSPAPNSSSDVKSGEIGGATIVPSSLGK